MFELWTECPNLGHTTLTVLLARFFSSTQKNFVEIEIIQVYVHRETKCNAIHRLFVNINFLNQYHGKRRCAWDAVLHVAILTARHRTVLKTTNN